MRKECTRLKAVWRHAEKKARKGREEMKELHRENKSKKGKSVWKKGRKGSKKRERN